MWVHTYAYFVEALLPEFVGAVEEFDVKGVVVADHYDLVLSVFINEFYFGDGVLDQILSL